MKKVFLSLALLVATTAIFSVNSVTGKKEVSGEAISCRLEANAFYDDLTGDGFTHREARSMRREFVRWCRATQ